MQRCDWITVISLIHTSPIFLVTLKLASYEPIFICAIIQIPPLLLMHTHAQKKKEKEKKKRKEKEETFFGGRSRCGFATEWKKVDYMFTMKSELRVCSNSSVPCL